MEIREIRKSPVERKLEITNFLPDKSEVYVNVTTSNMKKYIGFI